METINAIGRRKAAVARVYLTAGKGNISINGKELSDFFPQGVQQSAVKLPLEMAEAITSYDVKVNVKGGGVKGQSEAIQLGLVRALVKINEEVKPIFKAKGMTTRDSRVVERKKPGQPKARKSFQFSKR